MTRTEIRNTIKEAEKNAVCKWRWQTLKATKNEIILTNDYVAGITKREVFVIKHEVDPEDGAEFITAKTVFGVPNDSIEYSGLPKETITTLIYDPNWKLEHLNDFTNAEDGLRLAVASVVKHFYYYY